MDTIPAADRAYIWVSPRGFANEATIYIVPTGQVDTALARLDQHYVDSSSHTVTQLDNGKDAYRRAMKDHVDWAHTDWYGQHAGSPRREDPMADTIAASMWLYAACTGRGGCPEQVHTDPQCLANWRTATEIAEGVYPSDEELAIRRFDLGPARAQ